MKTLSQHLKEVATEEIGVREIGYTNRGERVQQYQAATNLKGTGWPWCAAFICFVVREAMVRWEKEHGRKLTFKRPQTAAAYGFDEWSLAQDNSTKTRRRHTGEPIGIFSLHSTSHCGIAITKPDKNGFFLAIEGNSNTKGSRDGGGVVRQRRNISNVRDWITFTV
jgi:alkaline phosphatase